jgi:glycosyltransferase involved in cell wall biosynthesis
MIIMVYSTYNAASISDALGAPEYSYWFVRRVFWPVLERFGVVVPVTDPVREVDTIRVSAAAHGQDCVFLSFEPPHKTILGLSCRTIPVFAWEFDTMPSGAGDEDTRHDWRHVLAETGSAITHSSFSVATVRATMGRDYPIWSIPAPVFDANATFAEDARPYQPQTNLALSGLVIDSDQVDLDLFSVSRSYVDGIEALRGLARFLSGAQTQTVLRVSGVVYTAVFNPIDGRKNFNDLLGGFLWAFRDVEDATLILKVTHADPVRGLLPVLSDLAKHGTYRCRVLLIHGMLPDAEYRALMRMTSYAVNVSSNEGQCLPLMEFMSAGRPSIAPAHTAMLDYVSAANSFIVRHTDRPAAWPHDSRQAFRTTRHALDVADLVRVYRESYAVAKSDPGRYAAMSRAATVALHDFCSTAIVEQRLAEVLALTLPGHAARAGASEAVLVKD